jgi:RNA recognition motif-containing protein
MNNRLYVENLPPTVNEGSVRELFSKLGQVTEVKLVMDASTGLSRGRAFVTMATPELAQAALKTLHSHSLGGRNIAVTEARPTEAAPTGLIGHGFEVGMGDTHVTKAQDNGRKKPQQQRYRPRHQKRKKGISNVSSSRR